VLEDSKEVDACSSLGPRYPVQHAFSHLLSFAVLDLTLHRSLSADCVFNTVARSAVLLFTGYGRLLQSHAILHVRAPAWGLVRNLDLLHPVVFAMADHAPAESRHEPI
jgi:hypothetical protein